MKVPAYQRQAQPSAAGIPDRVGALPDSNTDALVHAVSGLDSTIGAAAAGDYKERQAAEEKARREAQAQVVAEQATGFGNDITDTLHGNATPTPNSGSAIVGPGEQGTEPTSGFLDTRGKAAVAASAPTLEDLEGLRKKREDGITDPVARELFKQHSSQMLLEARRQVESHVSQQREVTMHDTAALMEDEAVRTTSADPANDKLAAERVAAFAAAVHHMGKDPDFEQLQATKLQADVASARLDNLLAPGPQQNIAKAREVLAANRAVLGRQLDNYERLVGSAERVAGAAPLAATLVRDSLRTDGSLDERKLYDGLSKVATTHPELFKDVQAFAGEQAMAARRAYDGETNKLLSRAVASYNNNGWQRMPVELKQALNSRKDDPRGPDLYKSLERGYETELDRLERLQRIRSNDKVAIREQNTIDAITKNEWEQEVLKDPKTADLDLFLATHGGVSDKMKSQLPTMQQKLINQQNKGLLSSRSEFVRQAADAATGFIAAKAGTRKDKDAATVEQNDFEAYAGRAFDAFLQKHEKEPLPKDVSELTTAAIQQYMGAKGPLVPHTTDAGARAGAAIAADINKATGAGGPTPPRKVEIVDDQGNVAKANEAGIDTWLKTHPHWKRKGP